MNFKDELQDRVHYVEQVLQEHLPQEIEYQKTVADAMSYSLLAGGKRLRPIFMLESYRLFGGKEKVIEYFMAAIELIHTYSLVHDDLPAMDNDEYRRGRKTTHVVYGEAMGILAGDGLLNLAFETAAGAFDTDVDAPLIGRAMQILSRKAGVHGMIGGQCVDVESVGQPLSKEKLDFIYSLKTGALLEASMMVGAVLAGAGAEQVLRMERIAADVGLAFQIQDDILDLVSTTQELGKPVNSDEKNMKTTYVTLVGLEQAASDVENISNRAIEALHMLEGEYEFLEELIRTLIHRRK